MTRDAPLDTEEAARSLNESDLLVAHLVLRPFVDAYRVVAEELLNLGPGRDVDEQELLKRCLRLGRQWSLQHRITEESVSGDMFSTALKMARHRGLLDARGLRQTTSRIVGQPSSPSSTTCSGRSVSWPRCAGISRRRETRPRESGFRQRCIALVIW